MKITIENGIYFLIGLAIIILGFATPGPHGGGIGVIGGLIMGGSLADMDQTLNNVVK